MKCPRCNGTLTEAPDEAGFIICPGCGAKLRGRTHAVFKVQSAPALPHKTPSPLADSGTDVDSILAKLEPSQELNPAATLPPGAVLPRITRVADGAAMHPTPLPPPPAPPPPAPPPVMRTPEPPSPPAASPGIRLEALMAELKELRRTQEEILALLMARLAEPSSPETVTDEDFLTGDEFPEPPPPAPVRTRRRKTVLLIDDDAETREAAVAAFELAEVPVRVAEDGNSGIAAIAAEKPDTIVLELGLSGSMAGKDVVNVIKATMEWVDIPIILYTRVAVESQKEARTVHGADEVVLKGKGATDSLIAKVIATFRRG